MLCAQEMDIQQGNTKLAENPSFSPQTKDEDLMPTLNRQATCPMLLRMFCREHGHHRLNADYGLGKTPQDDELIVYTW